MNGTVHVRIILLESRVDVKDPELGVRPMEEISVGEPQLMVDVDREGT